MSEIKEALSKQFEFLESIAGQEPAPQSCEFCASEDFKYDDPGNLICIDGHLIEAAPVVKPGVEHAQVKAHKHILGMQYCVQQDHLNDIGSGVLCMKCKICGVHQDPGADGE